MSNKPNKLHTTMHSKRYVYFILLAFLIPITLLEVKAQRKDSFKVSKKEVNVADFDKKVTKMMDDIGIPGMSLAIIENNEIVFSSAYGYKQLSTKEKVDDNTVFEGCSLSKSFLVYVIFKLVDENKFDLDKPMYEYLDPGAALNHDPRYKLITPRMILSHSSGLENWKKDNDATKLEIMSDPGKGFVYSGTGYNYLAAVIEQMLEKSYDDFVSEMITEPFRLERTFVKFQGDSLHETLPWNYAIGHNAFGEEYEKWMNPEPVPSSGHNLTAEDYAKLLIATFEDDNLSESSVQTILKPVVRTNEQELPYYYGTGFELIYCSNDTLIGHGGSNDGFKGQMFYSPSKKRGIVFLTNSDRGKLITTKLSEMTVDFDINQYYSQFPAAQYPNASIDIFKAYREKGADEMFAMIEKMKAAGKLSENTLNELASEFMSHDVALSKRLIEENIKLYPASTDAQSLLAKINEVSGE